MPKNLRSFLYYYARSMRLYYCFITGASVLAGVAAAKSASGGAWGAADFIVVLSGFFAWGVNQIFSDYFDIKEDKINAPRRPMACGKLDAKAALFLSFCAMTAFAAVLFFISPLALCALLVGGILNVAYSRLKKVPVLGCLVYAISISSCAVCGFFAGLGGEMPQGGYSAAAILVGIMLPAHFLMCSFSYYKDKHGDALSGIKTLQVIFPDTKTLPAHFAAAFLYSAAVSIFLGNIFAAAACFAVAVFLLLRLVKNLYARNYHPATKLNCQLCSLWLFCVCAKYDARLGWGILASILLIEIIFAWYKDEKE